MAKALTISRVVAENFLSLQRIDIHLSPLSVLVGPNGAGKSNVLKLFQFLGDVARRDLIPAIDVFGGFENLFFRGSSDRRDKSIKLHLTGTVTKHASDKAPDEYKLSFWQRNYGTTSERNARRMVQRSEQIVLKRMAGRGRRITLSGNSIKFEPLGESRRRVPAPLSVQGASTGLATLRRLGEEYEAAQIEQLAQVFEQLRLFEIDVEKIRRPARFKNQEKLQADGSNLAAFLYWLSEQHPIAFERLCEDVRFVLPGFMRFEFVELGGPDDAIRIDLIERHLKGTTPLARASFGTIRSIALFAMLHDPDPPKLTCIEEIDHGLHPHALDRLVDRLREASEKTQLILATHSPALVNRLNPEELIVVERNPETGASRIVPVSREDIDSLREETGYDLGELWFSGFLGGGL